MQKAFYKSPIGNLEIKASEKGICEINFTSEFKECEIQNQHLKLCIKELDLYFAKKLKKFSVCLDIKATLFETTVYEALVKIPYGKTLTYKDIAKFIKNEKSYRAVGNANRKNKIPIIIPCHRVVASDSLGGYSGGLDKKIFLLNLEKD